MVQDEICDKGKVARLFGQPYEKVFPSDGCWPYCYHRCCRLPIIIHYCCSQTLRYLE